MPYYFYATIKSFDEYFATIEEYCVIVANSFECAMAEIEKVYGDHLVSVDIRIGEEANGLVYACSKKQLNALEKLNNTLL